MKIGEIIIKILKPLSSNVYIYAAVIILMLFGAVRIAVVYIDSVKKELIERIDLEAEKNAH
jgi:hypothetical protein